MPTSYGDRLREGRARAGVWGCGYIGYSTLMHLADAGITCVAVDVDAARVDLVNAGLHPVAGLEAWLDVDPVPRVASGQVRATHDPAEVLAPDVEVHFITVPTERDGEPWWEPHGDVLGRIARAVRGRPGYRPLVIIESTLTPGTTNRLIVPAFRAHGVEVGRDVLLGLAPRRDWFVQKEMTLRTLDRIYGGFDEESAAATHSVLELLCDTLHRASGYAVAELVKPVENAYRHMDITLANQLSVAFPSVDVHEVLRLAATKWNVGLFQPSFGTGGYCIPLSSKYLLEGAERPELLTLLASTIETDLAMRAWVADTVLEQGATRVAILGLAYRGDIRVSIMSPTLLVARRLLEAGAEVRVFDPYYSADEIRAQTGADTFDFPGDLAGFDAVLVTTDHRAFLDPRIRELLQARADPPLILDNFGLWREWEWPAGSRYHYAGSPGWIPEARLASTLHNAPGEPLACAGAASRAGGIPA